MANDFEQLIKDVFGESFNRLNAFQGEQVKRLQQKVHDIAREAMKDELAKLQGEIVDLRARVATLEAERIAQSAEQV
jgi:hypothetical protein